MSLKNINLDIDDENQLLSESEEENDPQIMISFSSIEQEKKEKLQKKTKKPNTDPDIQSLIEELSNNFGHKVSINQKSKNKGQIEITYTNADEREIIIDKLKTFKGD